MGQFKRKKGMRQTRRNQKRKIQTISPVRTYFPCQNQLFDYKPQALKWLIMKENSTTSLNLTILYLSNYKEVTIYWPEFNHESLYTFSINTLVKKATFHTKTLTIHVHSKLTNCLTNHPQNDQSSNIISLQVNPHKEIQNQITKL